MKLGEFINQIISHPSYIHHLNSEVCFTLVYGNTEDDEVDTYQLKLIDVDFVSEDEDASHDVVDIYFTETEE